MQRVKPEVYLISYPQLDEDEVKRWLKDIGGEKVLEHLTGDAAEKVIELAGRECYRSFDVGLNPNITKVRTDSEEYIGNLIQSEHGAVLEHAQCVWVFENISRVLTHELVRHRAGVGYSQVSLRYVRLNNLSFWLPPEIESNPEAVKLFEETFKTLEQAQNKLAEIYGIDDESFKTKKKLTSAFRRIAPIGLATGIVFSCNMRA